MRVKLKNIGIIKEADLALHGLTIIAGENDSGKSTIGKVLYSLIKTIKWSSNTSPDSEKHYIKKFNSYIDMLFHNQISDNGNIEFFYKKTHFKIDIKKDKCVSFSMANNFVNEERKTATPLFIETPYVWNIFASVKSMQNLILSGSDINFEIPMTLNDLYIALNTKLTDDDDKIKLDVASIIGGAFVENSFGDFNFVKKNQNIDLINTAMGIKYFGILQVLAEKNHLYKDQMLILDEPEVHLHPKWQLELAKVIVYLAKHGVNILVNSHSPYIIEALQRYAKHSTLKAGFYLADDYKIVEDENSLSKIFAKLSEPFDEFDAMDREVING